MQIIYIIIIGQCLCPLHFSHWDQSVAPAQSHLPSGQGSHLMILLDYHGKPHRGGVERKSGFERGKIGGKETKWKEK